MLQYDNVAPCASEPSQRLQQDRSRRPREKPTREVYRLRELRRLLLFRYGDTLPDDSDGRDFAYVMVCHLARTVLAIRNARGAVGLCDYWLREHCPWMERDERARMLERKPLDFGPDGVARWLDVTYALRCALALNTFGAIDKNRAERKALGRQRKTDRQRAKRRANGIMPRAGTLPASPAAPAAQSHGKPSDGAAGPGSGMANRTRHRTMSQGLRRV